VEVLIGRGRGGSDRGRGDRDKQRWHRLGSEMAGEGMDDDGMMLVVVEIGTDATAEDICYEGNCLCCSFFTKTQYRVSILWCKYTIRLFSLRIYRENGRMDIRR
jgi:hypothetical protein